MRRTSVVALGVLCAACGSQSSAATPGSQVVARVAGTAISAALFDVRLHSTLTAVAQGGGPPNNAAMTAQVRASVLRSLLIDTVIAEEAQAAHVAATPQEIAAQVAADTQAAGGPSQLQSRLASAGGSMAQLTDEIRSSLNEQKLEYLLAAQRATAAEQQLAAGAPFATLAPQLSDDTSTSAHGGEMGLVPRAQIEGQDPAYAAAVLALRPGQWTNPPIRDVQGYDIVELEQTSAAGLTLRHIIIDAPEPYTVKERPGWFAEAIFEALARDCAAGVIHVYIGNVGDDPCAAASASATPAPSATP